MKVLAYTSPARGHLHPMMGVLRVLHARGAEVHVRTLAAGVAGVRAAGMACEAIDPRIEACVMDDHQARTQIAAGRRSYEVWAQRAAFEPDDLRRAVDATAPDVVLVDVTTMGAKAAAEADGLRWAESRPFLLEDPAPGVPPFGLGLRPRGGPLGRVRDALVQRVAVAPFDRRARLPAMNAGRAAVGLPPLASAAEGLHRAPLTLYYSAEPFEYPRPPIDGVLPVGPCDWDPPTQDVGIALDGRPLVLVACSSEFQDDGAIAAAALRGLTDRFQVVVTCAGVDPASLPQVGGATVARILPHGPLLHRAAVTVCHGGMGITQRSLSRGVPVVIVPWARDQLDVARHAEHAGAGVTVRRRGLSPERLAAAVAEAATKRAGAAAVAAGYEATGGAERAADALAQLAGPSAAVAAELTGRARTRT